MNYQAGVNATKLKIGSLNCQISLVILFFGSMPKLYRVSSCSGPSEAEHPERKQNRFFFFTP